MKRLTALFALVLVISGCGARTVGTNVNDNQNNTNLNNGNVNTNVNLNNNNVDPPLPEFVTNEIRMISLMQTLGFELDQGPDCPAYLYYEDINNDRLCWAVFYAVRLNVDPSSGVPDFFMPNNPVNQASTWRMIREMFGFYPYREADCNLFAQDVWYADDFGTMCHKGLIPVIPEPSAEITLEDWNLYLLDLRLYLEQMNSRIMVGEMLLNTALHQPMDYLDEELCASNFDDVEDQSFECLITYQLAAHNMIDPQQINFRPDDTMTWAELFKLTAVAADLPGSSEECTTLAINHWAEEWVNAFCERGLLPEGITDINVAPSMAQAALFLAHVEIEFHN